MTSLDAHSERPARLRSSLSVPLLAACVGLGIWMYMNAAVWTPLQRYYWNEYLNTEMFQGPRGQYSILETVDRRGQHRMAVESDVVPSPKHGRQFIPFVLSNQARQGGAVDLVVDTVHYGSRQMNQVLGQRVYNGQSVTEFTWPAWASGLSVFILGVVWSFRRHRMRRNLHEHGRRLKGPQIITVKQFNRWSGANGIGFSTTTRGEMVCIPRSFESSHMMIMGDSGTGKSALQRQLLMQIMERRERPLFTTRRLNTHPSFTVLNVVTSSSIHSMCAVPTGRRVTK